MAAFDWRSAPAWTEQTPAQRLALMGLLEADGRDYDSAANTVHANINRARGLGWDTDKVLNYRGKGNGYGWFQPLYEPTQFARALRLRQSPEYARLTAEAEEYLAGRSKDRVKGATHYLSHAPTMLALEAREPRKYRSWRGWSGFDPSLGDYAGKTYQDASHSFVTPQEAKQRATSDILTASTSGGVVKSQSQPEGPNQMPVVSAPLVAPGGPAPAGAGLLDPALTGSTKRQEAIAQLLMSQGNPIQAKSKWEAISRAFSGIGGAYIAGKADDKDTAKQKALIGLLGGQNLSPIEQYALASGEGKGFVLSKMLENQNKSGELEKLRANLFQSYGENISPELKRTIESGDLRTLQHISDQRVKNTIGDQKDNVTQAAIKRNFEILKQAFPNANPEDLKLYADQLGNKQTVSVTPDGKHQMNHLTGEALDLTTGTKRSTMLPFDPTWRTKQGAASPVPLGPGESLAVPPTEDGGATAAVMGSGAAGSPSPRYGGQSMPGVIEPADGSVPLGSPAYNETQKKVAEYQSQLRQLDDLENSFEPEFLMAKGRAKNTVDQWSDWLTGKEVFGTIDGRAQFTTGAEQFFNAYRVSITGAAAAQQELEMLRKATINMEIGPTEFKARMKQIRKRAEGELQAKYGLMRGGIQQPGAGKPPAGAPPATTPSPAAEAPPLPKDRSKLEKGTVYRLGDGRKAQYNGIGFDEVP